MWGGKSLNLSAVLHSRKVVGSILTQAFFFWMEFGLFPCACVGSFCVLWLPPTVQRHASCTGHCNLSVVANASDCLPVTDCQTVQGVRCLYPVGAGIGSSAPHYPECRTNSDRKWMEIENKRKYRKNKCRNLGCDGVFSMFYENLFMILSVSPTTVNSVSLIQGALKVSTLLSRVLGKQGLASSN